jgi:hypothetical protein
MNLFVGADAHIGPAEALPYWADVGIGPYGGFSYNHRLKMHCQSKRRKSNV